MAFSQIDTSMEQTIEIMPLGNYHYLWSIGFVVLSLLISLWSNDYIKEKKEYLFFLPLAAFMAATLHSVGIGIDLGTTFIIFSIIYALVQRKAYRPRLYMWLIAAYFCSLALSLIWSQNIPQGLRILRRSLPLITFSAAWCMFRLSQAQWERLLLVYFRASLLFIIFSIATTFYVSITEHFSWFDFFGLTKHPVNGVTESYRWVYAWAAYVHPSYNAYGLVTGLICGQYLVRAKRITYIEAGVFAVLLFLLLVLSQSRIGIVMYGITVMVATAAFIRSARWKKIYDYGMVAMLAVILVGWIQISTVFSIDPAREHIYHVTVDFIQQHPVLGVGVGSLADTLQQDEICRLAEYGNPHNQLMGDWMQGGLISVAALLLMMGYIVYYAVRYRNLELALFAIITLLFMQIEMPLDIIKGLTTFAIFVHLFAHKPNDRYNLKYASM